jgi:hypothetical protein
VRNATPATEKSTASRLAIFGIILPHHATMNLSTMHLPMFRMRCGEALAFAPHLSLKRPQSRCIANMDKKRSFLSITTITLSIAESLSGHADVISLLPRKAILATDLSRIHSIGDEETRTPLLQSLKV